MTFGNFGYPRGNFDSNSDDEPCPCTKGRPEECLEHSQEAGEMASWTVVEDAPIEYCSEKQKSILRAQVLGEALKQIGKLGGQVKSKAKARASRKNGKLGGRPKKQVKAPQQPSQNVNPRGVGGRAG